MSVSTLTPCSAFAGLIFQSAARPRVLAWDPPALALASVVVRRGQIAELRRRVRAELGMELPEGPRRTHRAETAFVGTGPGIWLALANNADPDFHSRLGRVLGPIASVADQSGAYALLRLSGAQVRSALGKLVPIDLHPRSFDVGAAASTGAAQIPAHIWRLEDRAGAEALFEMAVPRSLALSFWHALRESAAEFGLAFNPD